MEPFINLLIVIVNYQTIIHLKFQIQFVILAERGLKDLEFDPELTVRGFLFQSARFDSLNGLNRDIHLLMYFIEFRKCQRYFLIDDVVVVRVVVCGDFLLILRQFRVKVQIKIKLHIIRHIEQISKGEYRKD